MGRGRGERGRMRGGERCEEAEREKERREINQSINRSKHADTKTAKYAVEGKTTCTILIEFHSPFKKLTITPSYSIYKK